MACAHAWWLRLRLSYVVSSTNPSGACQLLFTNSHVPIPVYTYPCFHSHVPIPMFPFPCFHSHVSAGVLTVVVTPSSIFVPPGNRVSFRCLVDGAESEQSLEFSWVYPPQPGVVITGQTLLVSSVGQSSEGAYICTVNDTSTGAVASANGILEIGKGLKCGGENYMSVS